MIPASTQKLTGHNIGDIFNIEVYEKFLFSFYQVAWENVKGLTERLFLVIG